MKFWTLVTISLAVLLHAQPSLAASTPVQKCEGGKNKVAGKLEACLHKARTHFVSGGETDMAAYNLGVAKCEASFAKAWQKFDEVACPGDQTEIGDYINECVASIADALAGSPLPSCVTDLATCNDDLTSCETAVHCGDGTKEGAEACDGGGSNSASCDLDCTLPACGDGIINRLASEECDDGGMAPNDGCSSTCLVERCGDGTVQTREECDDGNSVDTDSCRDRCLNPRCGDTVRSSAEVCESGGVNIATCDYDCTLSICGDGIWNPAAGEECDDSNANSADYCTSGCRIAICGDAITQAVNGERCDTVSPVTGTTCNAGCGLVESSCADGIDNDEDGDRDVADSDCYPFEFVTSQLFNGNLNAAAAATSQCPGATGVLAADCLCQTAAQLSTNLRISNPANVWQAFIGDSSHTVANGISDHPYQRVDGAVFADGVSDMTGGTLNVPLDRNQNGTAISTLPAAAWMRTASTCSNWSSSSGSVFGEVADFVGTNWDTNSVFPCSNSSRLLCLQVIP